MAFADYGAMPLTGLQEASLTSIEDRGYLESFTDEFGKGIIRGFLNVGEGLVGTTEWLIPGKQESLLQAKERIEQAGTSFAPQIDNPAAWTGRVIGEALPYMGSAMVGGVGAGGVAGGLGAAARGIGIAQKLGAASIAFSVEGQQAYDDAIASGASDNEATAERLIIGSINAAIEAVQIDRLLKFHKSGGATLKSFIRNIRNKSWDLVGGDAKKFTGDVLRHALIEGIEEVAQEGTSISVPAFLRGDIKRNPDGTTDWGYVVDRLAQAGLGGAVAGGVLGGAGAMIGASPEIGRPSAEQFDSTIENIRNAPLKSSKKQKGRFTQQEKDYWISVLEEQKVKTLGDEITLDKWTNTETGRSLSLPAFRAERISPITGEPQAADAGFYGEGTYYSANKEGAARYGEPKEYKIELTNPFVVNTPSQIYSFIEKLSGPEYAVKENQIARPKVSREISRKLKEQGYDGIVIKSPYKAESPEIVVFDKGKTVSKSINVYKTTTGSRAGITEEEVSYNKETGDYTDKITGDPVILDQEASRGSLTETQALNRNYDNALVKAVNDIDTSLREEHIKKIRRETGKAFTNFNEILRTAEGNPRARFALAMQALKGTKSLIYDPVKFDENQIEYYYGRAATAPITSGEKLDVVDGLNRLFGLVQNHKGEGLLPMPHQIKSMEKVFGPEMRKALEKLRGGKKKMIRKIIDALNLPRAVLASFDVSAGGRQGLLLLPIARGKWFKAVGQGYRAWTSPEYADYIDLQIKTHPMYKKFIDNGGHLSQIGSLTGGEEIFISEFAHKIPGIRASERAYTTTLNSLRFYTFAKYAQQWQGTGKTANDYRTLAKFINHATGRGDIKGLEEYAPALNAAFFAPRLFLSLIHISEPTRPY